MTDLAVITVDRVLVCGGRDFSDWAHFNKVMDRLLSEFGDEVTIVHGAAKGADLMAEQWAKNHEIEYMGFPAKWKQRGLKAGYERNARMLKEGRPDLCIAFKGGKGTTMMVKLCRNAGIPVWVWVDKGALDDTRGN